MLSLWWLFLLRAAAPKTHLVSHYSIKRNIDNKYSHNHKLQSAPDPKTNPKISWSLGIRNSTSGSASNGRSNGRKKWIFRKMVVLEKWIFWKVFKESVKHHKKCSKLQNKLVYTYLVRCDNEFFGIRHTLSLSKIIYGASEWTRNIKSSKIFKIWAD